MGYLHINNLYKCQDILMFRECYALEKVHGTSAHVAIIGDTDPPSMHFSPGAAKAGAFEALFDRAKLTDGMRALGHRKMTVYGEAYGGGGAAGQGMSATYGKALCFIVFDVFIGAESEGYWQDVPTMAATAMALGLESVPYERVSTDLAVLDRERDRPSDVASRRGCGMDKRREGIVLRPLVELQRSGVTGGRIIAKHKLEEFSERATPQKVVDAAKLEVLAQANAIAEEWVTEMRLTHVLDRLTITVADPLTKANTRDIISAMVEDVYREAKGEIVESKDAETAIGRKAAALFHARLSAAR